MSDLAKLATDVWRSFRALDTWVQVWVAWLVAINAHAVRELDTPTGRTTAMAMAGWGPVNVAILVKERGLSSSLSGAHLLLYPWTVKVAVERLRSQDAATREKFYAALIAATNSVSLAFDAVDFAKWVMGDREVAGSA